MSVLKKYLGDPNIVEHLDFEKSDYYGFNIAGQKLELLSPNYSCMLTPESSSNKISLKESSWQTANMSTGPYQLLLSSSWMLYNQKLFNKTRMGGISFTSYLRRKANFGSFQDYKDLYSHISHTIAEHYRISGGGMINQVEGYWTHEVTYSEKENDFFLLNNNGLNWLCGYKLSEGFIENSFYHTLLNEDVVIELKFSRSIDCGHSNRPAVIEAMNAAERDFIRHFKLEPKENTLAIQNMLAEQYQGKVLTLDDIGGASETKLTLNNS